MDTWKIILIALLVAIFLGCVIGVMMGKYQIKKKRGEIKAILNTRERIIYLSSVVVGVVCILLGLYFNTPQTSTDGMDGMNGMGDMDGMGDQVFDDGMMGGEMLDPDMQQEDVIDSEIPEDGETPDFEGDQAATDTDEPVAEEAEAVQGNPSTQAAGGTTASPRIHTRQGGAEVVIMG